MIHLDVRRYSLKPNHPIWLVPCTWNYSWPVHYSIGHRTDKMKQFGIVSFLTYSTHTSTWLDCSNTNNNSITQSRRVLGYTASYRKHLHLFECVARNRQFLLNGAVFGVNLWIFCMKLLLLLCVVRTRLSPMVAAIDVWHTPRLLVALCGVSDWITLKSRKNHRIKMGIISIRCANDILRCSPRVLATHSMINPTVYVCACIRGSWN